MYTRAESRVARSVSSITFSHAAARLASDCHVPWDLRALVRISAGWRSIVICEVRASSWSQQRSQSPRNQPTRGSFTTTESDCASSPASHVLSSPPAPSRPPHTDGVGLPQPAANPCLDPPPPPVFLSPRRGLLERDRTGVEHDD